MSSSQDDIIELVDFNSPSSSKNVKNLRVKKNKIGSPPSHSPINTVHSKTSENSELFIAKSQQILPRLPPLPKPRKYKTEKPSPTSRVYSDRTSTSKDVSEISSSPKNDKHISEATYSGKIDSTSDTRSYRSKIKERFEMVKNQAVKSISKANDVRTLKGRSKYVMSLNKSINMMKKENFEIDNELKNYRSQRMKQNDEVSKIEMYNFFCEENNIEMNIDEIIRESKNEMNHNKSSEELIQIDKDLDTVLVYKSPEFLEFNVEVAENDLLWQPSRTPLTLEEKLNHKEPRYLAEEGFYIPNMPKITKSQKFLLEQRLFSYEDIKWFDCEGNLKMLENPVTTKCKRPNTTELETLTEFTKPFKYTLIEDICNSVLIIKDNILEVHITTLKFKHHPLFSIEHVLIEKLINHYDIHRQFLVSNRLERLKKRLEAVRQAKIKLKEKLKTSGDKADYRDEEKMIRMIKEIKNLRDKLQEDSKSNRNNTKKILDTWKAIKKVRDENKYSSTTVKLIIRKEKHNYEEEQVNFEKEIKETVNEIVEEMELEHKIKLLKYKESIEEWKLKEKDETPSKLKKPKKPVKIIDEDVLKQEVSFRFKECFKSPGEPILHFSINFDNKVEEDVDNNKEKMRRNAVSATKLQLKILCDNNEVCKSKNVFLNENFTCVFDENISIKLNKIPENVAIEIYEQTNTLLRRKICEISLKVSLKNQNVETMKFTEEHFIKEEIIHYKHEGVGSNITLKNILEKFDLECDEEEILFTSGFLTYSAAWEKNYEMETQNDENDVVLSEFFNEKGMIDVKKIKDWIYESKLDPLDPKNAILFEYLNDQNVDVQEQNGLTKEETSFRLNAFLEKFKFCEKIDLQQNIRFRFLELRNQNEPEFVGMVVPSRLKEIPSNVLTAYLKRIKEENDGYLEDDFENDIDLRRSNGFKYLKKIYTKVFQQYRCIENNLEYEDVVNEKMMLFFETLIKTLILNILNWFKIQPTISKPLPKLAKTEDFINIETNVSSKVQVTVTVISAINVPVRINRRVLARKHSNRDDKNSIKIQSFVKVRYQNMQVRTNTIDGQNPAWNEDLILPLEASNIDYISPNALEGSIILDLFDEVSVLNSNGEKKLSEVWLGVLRIPLSAVFYNGKLEGLFRLESPQILLGYQNDTPKYEPTLRNLPKDVVYLNLKIVVESKIPRLHPSMGELQCGEPPYLKNHILQWNERYNDNFPQRKFSVLAIDVHCKTICVTRFIKPLEPPQINAEGFDVSPEQCARYVSLIPFTDCNVIYQNVWLTTKQFLKIMTGSLIDHAVTLTCFLLSLNMEVWLLLGFGIPNGMTGFVLIKETNKITNEPSYYIFEVTSGRKYSTADPFSPLQKVFCVINEHNVWANIQRSDEPPNMRFDFNRMGDWLPLFNNQITAPTNSIQQKLMHRYYDDVQEIEIKLEKKLKKTIMKLRKLQRTIWNHHISNGFKVAITKFEWSMMLPKPNFEMMELKNFLASYLVNGFITCIPYTNKKLMTEFIKSTKLYLSEEQDVEFAFAIHAHPYLNGIISVWIVFATVTLKN